jgi:hypothetical protein
MGSAPSSAPNSRRSIRHCINSGGHLRPVNRSCPILIIASGWSTTKPPCGPNSQRRLYNLGTVPPKETTPAEGVELGPLARGVVAWTRHKLDPNLKPTPGLALVYAFQLFLRQRPLQPRRELSDNPARRSTIRAGFFVAIFLTKQNPPGVNRRAVTFHSGRAGFRPFVRQATPS